MLKSLLSSLLAICIAITLHGQVLEIWEIQGASLNSNYQGQRVRTENNVVTAKGSNFFFIQTPSVRSDNKAETSDGLLVLTSGSPAVKVGDLVHIEGTVLEEENTTAISNVNLQLTVIASDQELPAAIALNADFPGTQRVFVPDLEQVESMRVTFDGLICGPPEDRDWIPVTTQATRRFREAGIPYPGLPNLPIWDGNPELFWIDLDALGQSNNRFVGGQTRIQMQGVMVEISGSYVGFPSSYTLTGDNFVRPVRAPENGEFTIGCINTLRLIRDESAYSIRVRKMAAYIVQQLRSPDIVAIQEIGGINELEDLAFHIRQLEPGSNYQAQFLGGNGNISTAFLVRPSSFQNIALEQLSKNEFLSIGGTLHDRPPLLLSGEIPTTPPTPLKVLNLHLRSLIGITGSNSTFVRTKRREQAISVAEIVQENRADNLVLVGDFNAFQFSDGYVDVVNQIAGTPTEGALLSNMNIVSPPLIKYVDRLPETERYSFIFQGNAQMIDHCLSTELEDFIYEDFQFARGNADNSWIYTNSANILERSSDHDGFVLFLRPKNTGLTSTSAPSLAFDLSFSNPMSPDQAILVDGTLEEPTWISWMDAQGRILHRQMLRSGENRMGWQQTPLDGLYFVQIANKEGQYTTKIILKQ